MNKQIFSIIGGDERFEILARLIASRGSTTFAAGFDTIETDSANIIKTDAVTAAAMADIIILPLPATKDGATIYAPFSGRSIRMDKEFTEAASHSRIYTGFADKLKKQQPDFEKLSVFDYSMQEVFLIRNAQATAEAIVMLAIEHIPILLCGSNILITGCGRIGKFTGMMLSNLGANVYAATRNPENAAVMSAVGAKTLDYNHINEIISDIDLIINTAPAYVLYSREREASVKIDLASIRGIAGDDVIWARGLPGKYAPERSGKLIADTVLRLSREVC